MSCLYGHWNFQGTVQRLECHKQLMIPKLTQRVSFLHVWKRCFSTLWQNSGLILNHVKKKSRSVHYRPFTEKHNILYIKHISDSESEPVFCTRKNNPRQTTHTDSDSEYNSDSDCTHTDSDSDCTHRLRLRLRLTFHTGTYASQSD